MYAHARTALASLVCCGLILVGCADTSGPMDVDVHGVNTADGSVTVHLTGAAEGTHPGKEMKENTRKIEIGWGDAHPTTFAFHGARAQYDDPDGACFATLGGRDGPPADQSTADYLAGFLTGVREAVVWLEFDKDANGTASDGHDLTFNFFDDEGRRIHLGIFAHGQPPPTIHRSGGTFTVSAGEVRVWLREGPPRQQPRLFCGDHGDSVVLSDSPAAVAPPEAPAEVAAVAVSSTQIDLGWTPVSGAQAYGIQRRARVDGTWGNWELVGATSATSYADTGLEPGVRYRHRVRACNDAGCSGWTLGPLVITPVDPPEAPAVVSAEAVSSTRIDLAWTTVDGAASYRIQRRTRFDDGWGSWTLIEILSLTTYRDTGLEPGTRYRYRVRGCNAGGCSPWTNGPTVATPE
jgi:hypothetical protein